MESDRRSRIPNVANSPPIERIDWMKPCTYNATIPCRCCHVGYCSCVQRAEAMNERGTIELGPIERAVNDAAKRVNTTWISLVFLLAYTLVATGKITHKDLFLETPVRLPILAVDVPLEGYFWFVPALILGIHLYFCLLLAGLAGCFREYETTLHEVEELQSQRIRLRYRLDNSLFARVLGNQPDDLKVMLRVVAWLTSIVAPVWLLLFIQLTYLPQQNEAVTCWHRALIGVDSVLSIYALWQVLHPVAVLMKRRSGESRFIFMLHYLQQSRFPDLVLGILINSTAVFIAIIVASFPFENQLVPWLTDTLLAARADTVSRSADKWFSNHLVLADQNLVGGVDLAKVEVSRSVRHRNFVGAIFDRSELQQADFTGSNLDFASFLGSKLARANFGCAYGKFDPGARNDNWFGCTRLDEALLDSADLSHADLSDARMYGASLNGANMSGAGLNGTHLEGAMLSWATLDGSSMSFIGLDGAALEYASLVGVTANGARLRGAALGDTSIIGSDFSSSYAQNAIFSGANLQGSSFAMADLEEAFFMATAVFGTDISKTQFGGSVVVNILTDRRWKPDYGYSEFVRDPSDLFRLPHDPENGVTYSEGRIDLSSPAYFNSYTDLSQDDINALIAKIREVRGNEFFRPPLFRFGVESPTGDWAKLIKSSAPVEHYQTTAANRLIGIACVKIGEQHVPRGLIHNGQLCPYAELVRRTVMSGKMPDGQICENAKALAASIPGLARCQSSPNRNRSP
jgi:uncharacterized protein YjbI with pentapeptide repeats